MKLSNLLRRDPATSTLRERAIALREGLSRREAVIGTAAALTAAPLPVVAASAAEAHPDAVLIALWQRREEAHRDWVAASARFDESTDARHFTEWPEALAVQFGDGDRRVRPRASGDGRAIAPAQPIPRPASAAGPPLSPFRDIAMTNVVAFTPRPRPPKPAAQAPLAGLALRIRLEEAAQTALDAADKIIAALDGIEDAAEREATETASAPRSAMSVQVVRLEDQESFRTTIAQAHAGAREETPSLVMADQGLKSPQDKVPTEASSIETAEVHTLFPSLPWGGAGNVVSAAGCAVLALVGMRA